MVVILAQTPLEMHKNVDSRADLVKTTLMIFYCFHVSTDVELYLIHCLTDLFYVNQINFLKCPLASVDLLHDTAEHQEVLNGAESGELSGVWSPAPLLTTFSAGALSVQKHLWAGLGFCCHVHKSPGPPALTSAPSRTPPLLLLSSMSCFQGKGHMYVCERLSELSMDRRERAHCVPVF